MGKSKRALSILLSAGMCLNSIPFMNLYAYSAETVIDVTDFGADPVGGQDSVPAVEKALAKAKEIDGPVTVRFPKGRYDLYPDQAPERELYVSNTAGTNSSVKDKKIGILVEDMQDVTIDGDGSELVFHGKMTEFVAINSENITFKNYSTDFEVPTVIDVTVEETDGNSAIVYVPECYNYQISGTTITWLSDVSPYTGQRYWTATNGLGYTQTYDEKTGLTQREGNGLFSNVTSIEDLGNNRLKFNYSSRSSQVRPGLCYQMRYTLRDTPGTFFWKSKDINLENIDIEYLHGFGMVGQHSENITLNDVDFEAPGEKGRTTAGFADFIQMSGCKGKIDIQNCTFSNPHDDPINIHGTFNQVTRIISENKIEVTYMHNETAGFPNYFVGDQIEFMTKGDMITVDDSIRTVTAVDGPDGQGGNMGEGSGSLTRIILTLDRPIPESVQVNSHVVENITYTPDVYIANNIFKETPTRGILCTTRGEVVIEKNYFDGMGMASIYISDDAQSWYESGPCRNVTIRDNVFSRPRATAILVEPTNPTVNTNTTVHSNFTIADNKFYLPAVQVLNAKSVADLSFTGNTIYRSEAFNTFGASVEKTSLNAGESTDLNVTANTSSAGGRLFSFNGCKDVNIADNTYDAGLNAGISLYNMQASDVTVNNDAARTNADNNLADNVQINYVSSNPSVVSINSAGHISAHQAGSTQVYAEVTTGQRTYKTEAITLTVEGESAVEAGHFQVNTAAESVASGESVQLTADTTESVTWSVSDESIASVNTEGLLTAAGSGPVVVTATAANGDTGSVLISVTRSAKVLASGAERLFGASESDIYPQGDGVAIATKRTGLYQQQVPGGALKVCAFPEGDGEVIVRTSGKVPSGSWGANGLYLMDDQDNYVSIERKERGSGNYKMAIVREVNQSASETFDNGSEGAAAETGSAEFIWMKLARSGSQITCSWSENGTDWDELGTVDGSFLNNPSVVFASLSSSSSSPVVVYDQMTLNGEAFSLSEESTLQAENVAITVDEQLGGLRASADVHQGSTRYFWAQSDSAQGPWMLIPGAENETLLSSQELTGKYIRVAAVPVSAEGCGSLIWSDAVQMTSMEHEVHADANAYLKSAEISGLSKGFAFDPNTQFYFTTAGLDEKEIDVNLVPQSSTASVTLTYNGQTVPASGKLQLTSGRNTLEVHVAAEDGETFRNYRFVISRTGDSNNDLASLNVNGTAVDLADEENLVAVVNNLTEAEISASAVSAGASVSVLQNGQAVSMPAALTSGDNQFQIVVQPEAPAGRKVYNLTVRNLGDNNADLSSLQTGTIRLNEKFSTSLLEYTAETFESTLNLGVEAVMEAAEVTVEANGKTVASGTGSAAAQISLKQDDNEIRIQVVSPDKSTTRTTVLHVTRKTNPADDSHDIDVSHYTATAGSVEERAGEEGPVALALDGDTNTRWHSNWTPDARENLWFDIELDETMPVNGLRYLPRQDSGNNGVFTKYRIEVSKDHGETYEAISTGDWKSDKSWKLALFETTEVTNVRIYCVENDGDGRNFASAAEIRLLYQPEDESQKSVYLSDLDWVSESHGNPTENKTERDLSTMKQPITLWNGTELQVFEKGLGTHADSEIVYNVADAGYKRFEAYVGVDADTANKSTEANIRFTVLADGVEVFNSGTMHFEENGTRVPMQKVSVDLNGVRTLTLKVVGVNNTWSAHADWADARFILSDETEETTDKSLLNEAVVSARALKESGALENVHPLIAEEFNTALTEAEAVLADEKADQSAVDTAWMNLSAAIQKLEWAGEKAGLQAVYDLYKDVDLKLYEDGAEKDAFVEALKNAKALLDAETPGEEGAIPAAIEALHSAFAALKEVSTGEINTTLLDLIVTTVKNADLDLYISEGKDNLNAALISAEAVLAQPASQAEVDAAASTLNSAWMQMRLKADEALLDSLREFRVQAASMNRSLYSRALLMQVDEVVTDLDLMLAKPEVSHDEAVVMADRVAALNEKIKEEDANRPVVDPAPGDENEPSLDKPSGDAEENRKPAADASADEKKPASADKAAKPSTGLSLLGVPAAGLGLSAAALAWMKRRNRKQK